jgi:E3 ubiquitin-protein ligase RFWD2
MEPSRGAAGGGRRWGDAEAEAEGDAADEGRRGEDGGEVSLREWLDRPGRAVEAAECVHVFRQVAEAVAVAHAQGVAVGSARPSCFVVSPPFARVAFIESASGSDASGSCSGSDASEDADRDASPPRRRDGAGRGEERAGKSFPLKSVLAMELNWYTSPEEADDSAATFASDVYRLGVLLFEVRLLHINIYFCFAARLDIACVCFADCSCSVHSKPWKTRCGQWRICGTGCCHHSCCSNGPRKHPSASC